MRTEHISKKVWMSGFLEKCVCRFLANYHIGVSHHNHNLMRGCLSQIFQSRTPVQRQVTVTIKIA